MAQPLTIEDLRLLAKRRVPRMFYDYADSGSYTAPTLPSLPLPPTSSPP